jgi:hypothetical protein
MEYVRRLAIGLLGLFIVLMTVGVFSKTECGVLVLVVALLGPKGERFGLSVGRSRQDREVS